MRSQMVFLSKNDTVEVALSLFIKIIASIEDFEDESPSIVASIEEVPSRPVSRRAKSRLALWILI